MADKNAKLPGNISGLFYVDQECIDCNLCCEVAPNNFIRNDQEAYDYVYKQPENQAELEQCLEAMESCPVEAIGDDGEVTQNN